MAIPPITLHIQPGFQMPGRERCFSGTPFAIKMQRILGWKRLPFDVHEVAWSERQEFMARTGEVGKLPILEYGDEIIEDSTAIAYFLEERHPEPALLPEDPLLRARCHFLEEWADEVMYWYGINEQRRLGPFMDQMRAYYPDLDDDTLESLAQGMGEALDETLNRQGIGRYPVERMQTDVSRGLDSLEVFISADGFVAGPQATLADCALFGQFHRRLAGTNPWLSQQFASRPVLQAWLDRVDEQTAPSA